MAPAVSRGTAIRALIAHPELGGTSELGCVGQTFGARTVGSTIEVGPCACLRFCEVPTIQLLTHQSWETIHCNDSIKHQLAHLVRSARTSRPVSSTIPTEF